MILAETYIDLLTDVNHWLFELTTDLVFAGIVALPFWPAIKRQVIRKHDEQFHEGEHSGN